MLKREVEGQLYLEGMHTGARGVKALFLQNSLCLQTYHKAFLYSKETPQHKNAGRTEVNLGVVFIPSFPGFPPGGHVWSPCVNDRHIILTGNVVDF